MLAFMRNVANMFVLGDPPSYTPPADQRLDARSAVVEAGRRRLRPILMTTLTTVLAMIPIALALGEGAEIQAPLARVILGGLIVSTLVTLVLLPALYVLTEGKRYRAST